MQQNEYFWQSLSPVLKIGHFFCPFLNFPKKSWKKIQYFNDLQKTIDIFEFLKYFLYVISFNFETKILIMLCDETFQLIYINMWQFNVRFPEIPTISPDEFAVSIIPLVMIFQQIVVQFLRQKMETLFWQYIA